MLLEFSINNAEERRYFGDPGSGLIDHIQKITVAAMQIADMKVCHSRKLHHLCRIQFWRSDHVEGISQKLKGTRIAGGGLAKRDSGSRL